MSTLDENHPVGDVTALLQSWAAGDRASLDRLMPMVYEELRRLAEHHMRAERIALTVPRTGLVHEAYLRLAPLKALGMQSRAQFFGLASSVMRHILVDMARARRAAKRDAGAPLASLDATSDLGPACEVSVPDEAFDMLALEESLRRLEALDPRQARVVEMRFFVGMDVEETAEALGLSATTVKREWATARAWLLRDLGLPVQHATRTRSCDGGLHCESMSREP